MDFSNITKITGKGLHTRIANAERRNDDSTDKQYIKLRRIGEKLEENNRQLVSQGTTVSRLADSMYVID